MNMRDMFAAILIISMGIGLIVVAVYTAAILAPIIAIAFLIFLAYSFLSSEPIMVKKKKKRKRNRRQ
jgi:uncharacterized membrane protein YfcA